MRGTIRLMVQSTHLKYEMEFKRNITILKGDSATGKTTLVDMIQEYNLNGSDTGINLSCDCPCRVIEGNTWQEQLNLIHGSLVFIDEGNRFVASKDFSREILKTDNYYVIVTRENLSTLPYSVTEIYGIHSSGKYASQEPVYHHLYRIYGNYNLQESVDPAKMIVEDSNAGYEFFDGISSPKGIECVSANGAGKIFDILQTAGLKEQITVIADGAAFGAQMEKVYQVLLRKPNIRLYLPESFEWLILSSGILRDGEVRSILENPAEFIESKSYCCWERFFTHLLVDRTENSYMKYTKEKLNPVFLQGRICEQIIDTLPNVLRNLFSGVSNISNGKSPNEVV